jgi:primosomal protein N' (replication factor Y)
VHRIESVKPGKRLVVATPGAEPWTPGGYQAVILLDGSRLLSKDTLRATEQAVALWSNALSLLAPDGKAVGVGLASQLGQRLALWQQAEIAADELASRRELRFPPACRLASITGPKPLIAEIVEGLSTLFEKPGAVEVLGPLPDEEQRAEVANPMWRYLIRYEYFAGEQLARELKARALKVNAANRAVSAKSGRASRAVRVRMDDSEVI